jgi:hypothetical protein
MEMMEKLFRRNLSFLAFWGFFSSFFFGLNLCQWADDPTPGYWNLIGVVTWGVSACSLLIVTLWLIGKQAQEAEISVEQ